MSEGQFQVEQPEQKSGCGCYVVGCLIVSLVLLVAACGIGYYALQNARTWTADIADQVLTDVIDESDLPEDQKQGMKQQIGRVTQGIRDGEVGFEQMGEIGQKLAESPAMTAIPVVVARHQYINPSGLSDEEKEDANLQLERVARGLFEKTLSDEDFDEIAATIADRGSNDQWEFKEKLTDDEVRVFVEKCREKADAAGVPNDRYEVDLAEELRRSIDEVLGDGQAPVVEID